MTDANRKKSVSEQIKYILVSVFICVAILSFSLSAAFADNRTSVSTKNCVGSLCNQPGNNPSIFGTTAGTAGGVAERNITFFFNVSSMLGHNIGNLRATLFYKGGTQGWAFSSTSPGTGMNMVGVLGFGSDYLFQPIGAIGGVNSATNTSSGLDYLHLTSGSSYTANGSAYYDFNRTYLVTNNIMAVSFGGLAIVSATNWNCVGNVGECQANNNTEYWGFLQFADGGVVGNFTIPSVTTSFYPIDNNFNSTLNEATFNTFLTDVRNMPGEGNYVIDKTGGLTRSTKGFTQGRLWLAAVVDSSVNTYPSNTRVFMQVNETFEMSDLLSPYKSTAVGSGWSDRYFESDFIRNFVYIKFGRFFYDEVTTSSTTGQKPFLCWSFFNRIPGTAQLKYYGICAAPNSTFNPSDRVVLTDSLGNYYASLTNSTYPDATEAAELVLDDTKTYRLVFVTTARGNITENYDLNNLGTFEVTSSQGRGGSNSVEVNMIDANGNSFTRDGTAKISALNADDYSSLVSQNIVTKLGRYSFPIPGPFSSRTPVFTAVHQKYHVLAENIPFSGALDTDILMGTVQDFLPSADLVAVTISCDPSYEFLSGQTRPVVCGVTYNSDVTLVGDLSDQNKITESIDDVVYRYTKTTTGSITGVSVTDFYSGSSVVASISGGSLILQGLKIIGGTGFSKLAAFTGAFTDSFGGTTSQIFSFTMKVVTHFTNSDNAVNHRAIFFGTLTNCTDSATCTYPLANFTVNISGSVCTTSLKSFNLGVGSNSTTVSECDSIMPNQLVEVPTSYSLLYNGTLYNFTLNQTYWGYYTTNIWAQFGLPANGYGSVYNLNLDTTQGRVFEKFDIYTCILPEVSIEKDNQNDRCKLKGCPALSTITTVEGVTVNPTEYTCSVEGQSTCTADSIANKAYVVSCGTSCSATTYLCSGITCNSDSSDCAGAPTIAEKNAGTGLTGMFTASPLTRFIFVDHMDFFVGFLIVVGVTVYLATQIGAGFAAILGGFLFLGLLLITLKAGFLILMLIAAIVAIWYAYKAYSGITGLKGE